MSDAPPPFPPPSPPAGAAPPPRPGAPECRFCAAPLTPHQAVRGVCAAPGCTTRQVQEAARAVFQRDWEAHVEAQRRGIERAAPAIATAVLQSGQPPEEIAFGVVPRQEFPIGPLPGARRAAFAAHLDGIVEHAFARVPSVDLDRRETAEPAEAPVLDAACATCQGKCCLLGGGTHAFLSAETVDLYRTRNPEATAPEIAAHYLSRLPEASVAHSCVYHGERGCVLPRRERADICNRYHCNPQRELLRRFRETPSGTAVIVAMHGEAGPAVALFDTSGGAANWQPIENDDPIPPELTRRVTAAAMAQMPTGPTTDSPPAPAAEPGARADMRQAPHAEPRGRA